jgi:hypothetical protein
MLSPNPLVSIKVMAILTPSSSSSERSPNQTPRTDISSQSSTMAEKSTPWIGGPRTTILTDLDGFDLNARLDMSFFWGLIDRMRQDLGFAEGVDKSRTSGSRGAWLWVVAKRGRVQSEVASGKDGSASLLLVDDGRWVECRAMIRDLVDGRRLTDDHECQLDTLFSLFPSPSTGSHGGS